MALLAKDRALLDKVRRRRQHSDEKDQEFRVAEKAAKPKRKSTSSTTDEASESSEVLAETETAIVRLKAAKQEVLRSSEMDKVEFGRRDVDEKEQAFHYDGMCGMDGMDEKKQALPWKFKCPTTPSPSSRECDEDIEADVEADMDIETLIDEHKGTGRLSLEAQGHDWKVWRLKTDMKRIDLAMMQTLKLRQLRFERRGLKLEARWMKEAMAAVQARIDSEL